MGRQFGYEIFAHDPVSDPANAERAYRVKLLPRKELPRADALAVCVAHREFAQRPLDDYLEKVAKNGSVVDITSILDLHGLQQAGLHVWRL